MSNGKKIQTDKIEITIDTISENNNFSTVEGFEKSIVINGKLIYKEFAEVSYFRMGDSINDILNVIRSKAN